VPTALKLFSRRPPTKLSSHERTKATWPPLMTGADFCLGHECSTDLCLRFQPSQARGSLVVVHLGISAINQGLEGFGGLVLGQTD